MSNYRLKLENPETDPGYITGQAYTAPRPPCYCDTKQHKYCKYHFEFKPISSEQVYNFEINYTLIVEERKGTFELSIDDVKVEGRLEVDYNNDCQDLLTVEHDLSTFEVNFETISNPFEGPVMPVVNEIDLIEKTICITF